MGGVVRRHTSGTTGKPVEVLWDSPYCDVVAALRLMNVRSTGTSHFAKTVEIQYWGPLRAGGGGQKPNKLRRLLVGPLDVPRLLTLRARTRGFRRNIIELENELLSICPSAMQSRPSYLRRLGAHLLRRGLKLPVRSLVTEGEYLSSAVRKDLSDMFDAEVFNTYGSMEAGPFGIECRIHEGIHLSTDYFAFEVVRDGQALSPGEQGEILVTTLDNKFMPLIRYRLGDSVVLDSEERCGCGSSLPRLKEVFGRSDDGLVMPTGGRIPTGAIVDYLERALGLRDYQLVQTSVSSFLLRLKVEQDNPSLRTMVRGYVTSLLGQRTDLEVEDWREDDIPPKYRPVISRLSDQPQSTSLLALLSMRFRRARVQHRKMVRFPSGPHLNELAPICAGSLHGPLLGVRVTRTGGQETKFLLAISSRTTFLEVVIGSVDQRTE